jgi:hypothetical protein
MFPDRVAEIIETRVRQPGLVAEAPGGGRHPWSAPRAGW